MTRSAGYGPARDVSIPTSEEAGVLAHPGSGETEPAPEVSVIVLVSERPDDLRDIHRTYSRALEEGGWSHEFLFTLESCGDRQRAELRELADAEERIRIVTAGRRAGEAALLRLGAQASRGRRILTLPAYQRVDPGAVDDLLRALDDADMALARRHPGPHSWVNRLQSRAFHFLLRRATGVELDDIGCGVRAMERQILEELPPYGDSCRFIPVFAVKEGYRVVQVDARQHPDDHQTRVYAPGTYLRRLIDLLGVFFLTRFTYKPLRFFGLVGAGLGAVGAAILLVLFFQRIGGQGIADRPLLLLGVLLATLGVQAFALGLIGEIIVHFHLPKRRYRLKEEGEGEATPPLGGESAW